MDKTLTLPVSVPIPMSSPSDPCCPDRRKESSFDTPIVNVNFWLTTGCNFRCRYCYEADIKQKEVQTATKEVVSQLLNWLSHSSISGNQTDLGVNFFGGEPLLCSDLIEFALLESKKVSAKTGKKFKFSMTTNASLLDEYHIRYYKEFEMGYLISIDGDLETMKQWRGNPDSPNNEELLNKVIENSKIVLKYVPNTTARLTLANSQVSKLFSNVLFLWSIGFNNISAHIITDGPGEISEQGIAEYENQLNLMYNWFKGEFLRRGNIPYNTVNRLIKVWDGRSIYDSSPCGAGKGFVGISPDGTVYPCHRFVIWPEWKLGDIFSYKLDQAKRKIFLEFKRKQVKECLECNSTSCSYQCFASSYAKFGNILTPHPGYCKIRKIEEEIAFRLMTDKDLGRVMFKKFQKEVRNDTSQRRQANPTIFR